MLFTCIELVDVFVVIVAALLIELNEGKIVGGAAPVVAGAGRSDADGN